MLSKAAYAALAYFLTALFVYVMGTAIAGFLTP